MKNMEINKLPETWDEVYYDGYYTSSDGTISSSNRYVKFNKDSRKNEYATKQLVEASIPLAKLSVMRQIYRDGWEPDWHNVDQTKFVIMCWQDMIITAQTFRGNHFLSFQSHQVRDLFLKNFKSLINQAKPLLFG